MKRAIPLKVYCNCVCVQIIQATYTGIVWNKRTYYLKTFKSNANASETGHRANTRQNGVLIDRL